jgi:hypothetical protein
VEKYLPDNDGLHIVGGESWWDSRFRDWYEWYEHATRMKIVAIRTLKCEIYIDDSPSFVRKLREALDIPVIQYGGRLSSRWNK